MSAVTLRRHIRCRALADQSAVVVAVPVALVAAVNAEVFVAAAVVVAVHCYTRQMANLATRVCCTLA